MKRDVTQPTANLGGRTGQGVKSVVHTLHWLFAALRILIVVVILIAVFGGVFYVREHEEAMLFRFGKLIDKELPDGIRSSILRSGHLYWAWPRPVDQVTRIPAERSVVLTTRQFWPRTNPNLLPGQPPPEGPGTGLVPGQDGYLLTGDANIMHMQWAINYRIRDAKKYYLNFYEATPNTLDDKPTVQSQAAEDLVRNCLENAVLKEVATWSVEDVITVSRAATPATAAADDNGDVMPATSGLLTDAVRQRVEALIDEMDIGIEVQQVNLINIQPPVSTLGSFREVLDAAQEFEQARKEAETYQNRVINEALGQKSEELAEARAYATGAVASVQAERDYFLKVHEEYEKNPETMLVALYTDTIREVLGQVGERYIIHTRPGGTQEVRLLLGPEPVTRQAQDAER